MLKLRQPKTLKMKLTLYFTMVTLLPSSLISIFYYYYSTQSLKKNMIENARTNTSYIMNNIDNQIRLAYRLSDWTFLNKNFEKVFINSSLQGASLTEEIINAKQTLEYYVMNSPIAKNISSIVISGNNSIDIRMGDDAAFIDRYELMKKPWFLEGYNRGGAIYLPGILENPAYFKRDDCVIPIVRPVIHSTIDYNIGWSYIAFKETLISDVYKAFDNPIYIIDRDGICISSSETQYITKSMLKEAYIKKMLESGKDDYFDIIGEQEEKLVVNYKSSLTGWNIVQKISYAPLIKQKAVVFRMSLIIFGGSILITFIFTMFLSSNLTAPLKNILKRMDYIAEGNFERDKTLEGLDEVGEIGRGINELASSIKGLLEKVKEEEAEKRVLELKVLENQVNPHFLYNTLNSIKWMATVQKAEGIRDIVSSLGRLLMNISKNASERISIRKELALTQDYIFIQNIRYNGKIKLEINISDEALLENEIVKFTLQPIVENAIFHGIEPKKDAGNIKIGIEEKDQKVIVSVEDDGVGIVEERIKEILTKGDMKKNRGLSGIGVKNVNERLKLNYGEEYGITIESVADSYTRVNVIIPKFEVDKMAGDLNV